MSIWLLAVMLSASCTRKIPPHLLVDEPIEAPSTTRSVSDLATTVELIAMRDPLVRAPPLPTRASLGSFPEGAAIHTYLDTIETLERGEGEVSRELQELEEIHPLTIVVPLSRGYRLRMAENRLAQMEGLEPSIEFEIGRLLVPLPASEQGATLPRGPLEWMSGRQIDPSRIRELGETWVLRGWFCSPDLPLVPVAQALAEPRYTALAATPLGVLLQSRAAGAEATSEGGWDALVEATWLSLNRAAADRDHEQAAWAVLRTKTASSLDAEDPIHRLLEHARSGLTADAADTRSAGGALLAIAAADWARGCTPHCSRVDRVSAMTEAGRWHADVDSLTRIWQVITLKDAIDTLEVGHDTVMYPRAAVGLVDALSGTGGRGLDQALLRRRQPEASTWLSLGRAIGSEGITDWKGAHEALGRHLAGLVENALAADPAPRFQGLLERVRDRAIP